MYKACCYSVKGIRRLLAVEFVGRVVRLGNRSVGLDVLVVVDDVFRLGESDKRYDGKNDLFHVFCLRFKRYVKSIFKSDKYCLN